MQIVLALTAVASDILFKIQVVSVISNVLFLVLFHYKNQKYYGIIVRNFCNEFLKAIS